MMLFLLLAQGVFYGTGDPPPARPQGIFSLSDYPAEAARKHWEGTVVADLEINDRGAITVCRVVQSSGHEILDATTCNLLIQRARFTPRKDDQGRPIGSTERTPPINWRLPR